MSKEAAQRDVVVVTAANSTFFELLRGLVGSLREKCGTGIHIGCYDLGLSTDQLRWLELHQVEAFKPISGLDAYRHDDLDLGYLARPFMRENFPDYDVYIWMDADTWVQGDNAVWDLARAAKLESAALTSERAASYRFHMSLLLWKIKNFTLGYGVSRLVKLTLGPHVNIGVFALKANSALWQGWQHSYGRALARTGRVSPHDQFSLNDSLWSGHSVRYMPATYNWVCGLAMPNWDVKRRAFCTPDSQSIPIEIMHLAGSIKANIFNIQTTDGRTIRASLRYGAERPLATLA